MKHTKYVVGFMFNMDMSRVALIRKNKPAWQEGLLNGIGGKIEGDEPAAKAMVREFLEEAGVLTFVGTWNHFCSMEGRNNDGETFEIEFFYNCGDLDKLISMEAEKIEITESKTVTSGEARTIGNLPWLVALAIDCGNGTYPPSRVVVKYD